ncbi:MAG: type I-C CRISPR-associated protein Cas8c/Csd1 [Thermoanaerobaculaceae bacterium]
MILQALKEYYDRKAADPSSGIAPEGFEKKEIPFVIAIKPDGRFVNLEDTREDVGDRRVAKSYLLPRSKTRTGSKSYATTFLLWDHIGYLFGHPADDRKAAKQHQTWLAALKALPAELAQDEGVQAILRFYSSPDQIAAVKTHGTWAECLKLPSCNMTFRLAADSLPIPCRKAVQSFVRNAVCRQAVAKGDGDDQEVFGLCLVTGQRGEIAKTHGRTPINKDTKSLVAFQKNSGYDSHGKEQGFNAPVSKSAEFAYTTALNTLLKSKRQRIRVGDAATVFWSARDSQFENEAPLFFDAPPTDDPDQDTTAVQAMYASIWNGTYVVPDEETRFYVLGLSPNAARIAVRFWHVATVREMGNRFRQHVDDLAITHRDDTSSALPIRRLLHSIAPLGDDDRLPPNLAGDIARSVLEGLPYPQTLLQAALCRIRAEQSLKNKRTGRSAPTVTYERAALIKASLNRAARFTNTEQEEGLHVSLDLTNTNIGYRLGRLFATLERIQIRKFTQNGGKEPNSTIRDRYYGAASGTPVAVFGTLIRLSKHHLASLENVGERVNFEKLLGEIMSAIKDFPAHLRLEDQGRFAIGYYHQMQDFYTKKPDNQVRED